METNDFELIRNSVISEGFFEMFGNMIEMGIDFSIVLNNGNDWDRPLPERLQKEQAFIINLSGDTLSEAELNAKGQWIISTEFDGELLTKIFRPCDIQGFANEKGQPILMKPFVEPRPSVAENLKPMGQKIPDEEALEHSMKMFKKHNPDLFKE